MKTGETHFSQLMNKVGYTLSEEEKKVEEKVIYLIICYSFDSANKKWEDLFNKGKNKDYNGHNVDEDAGFSSLEEAKKTYEDIIEKCLHKRDSTEIGKKLSHMELVEYFPERSALWYFQMKEFDKMSENDSRVVFEEHDWIREEPFRNFTIDKKTGNVTESEWSKNFLEV